MTKNPFVWKIIHYRLLILSLITSTKILWWWKEPLFVPWIPLLLKPNRNESAENPSRQYFGIFLQRGGRSRRSGRKRGAKKARAFERANLIQEPNLVFSILHAKRRAASSSSSSFIGFFLRSRCKLFKKLFLVHAIRREREKERNYFLLRFWVYMEI